MASPPRVARRGAHGQLLLALVALLGACASDPLGQLVRRLGDPLRREEAVAGLVQLVQAAPKGERERVRARAVDALMDAYREDETRAEIVAALDALGDPRAAPVFASALRDFERGGAYLEAAVRSARALGALGQRQEVPTLTEVLARAIEVKREEQITWLKRALIESLDRLGDPRAVDVLVKVLARDPARQDFYLNKLAASALGRLGDRRAIRPLTTALSSASHGLLLYEESRRALCRIGPAAAAELHAAAARRERGLPEPNATAAVRVLGDLGDRATAARLAALARATDPAEHLLAVAEARLRLGDEGGEAALREVLASDAALTARRWAADLLGLYGRRDSVSELVRAQCLDRLAKRPDPAQKVLCWSLALAHARVASGAGMAQLGALLTSPDAQTRHQLQTYRPRLELAARCVDDVACYRRALGEAEDWRARERAALELGRLAATDLAFMAELAGAFPAAHPQVKEAILISLEKASHRLDAGGARTLADRLKPAVTPATPPARSEPARSEPATSTGALPATRSRAVCLVERLERMAAAQRGERR